MKLIRKIAIPAINSLPIYLKWWLYSFTFFRIKLRIDFNLTRSIVFSRNSKLIVIGANDGFSFDDLFQSLDPKSVNGIVIEPSAKYFEKLRVNLKEFVGLKFIRCAIYNRNIKLKLFQLNDSGLGKLPEWGQGLGSFSKDHLLKFEGLVEDDLEFEYVDGFSFHTIVDRFALNRVDYLQVDTEGYDGEILKMIDFNTFQTKMIKFEIANMEQIEINEVVNKLSDLGFVLNKVKGDMVAYSNNVNPSFY